jgi:chlorophyll(ide) b reductase
MVFRMCLRPDAHALAEIEFDTAPLHTASRVRTETADDAWSQLHLGLHRSGAGADELSGDAHVHVVANAPVFAAVRARVPDGAPVYGTQCDVSDSASVIALGEFAKEKLSTIGYWINNAGINGGRRPFTDVPISAVEAVVKVNLLGVLLCTQVAIKLMHEQPGVEGHIFNTVGSGVKGGGTPGYVVYGATKRGLPQMTDSLVKELTEGVQGYERVPTKGVANCHTLSPGMVFTDLLLNDSTKELRKFPFGVLAAQPEEVAEDLIPKILATTGQGAKVEFLTTDRVLTKFVQRFLLGQKSQYIDDDGNVIKMPGAQYLENGVRALY